MICRKCGHELVDNSESCDKCGASIEYDEPASRVHSAGSGDMRPPEIYADFPPDTGNTPKPRKRNLFVRIIVVILLAVVFLCGLTVLGYYTFLPAKYTLLAAEYFTVQKSYKQLDSFLNRQDKLTDALYDTTVTSSTDFCISVDSSILEASGMNTKTAETVRDYLTNLSLNLTVDADMQNRKENVSAVLSYKNNPGLSVNLFLHEQNFGLNLPELSKTSLIGGLDDLRRLFDKNLQGYGSAEYSAIEEGDPWLSNRLREEISIDHESLRELMSTYSRAFLDGLDNKDLTIERGRKVSLLGEETGCQVVTATLDRKAQKELIEILMETAGNDGNLYELTFGNFKKVYKILSESKSPYADILDWIAGSFGIDLQKDLTKTKFKYIVLSMKNKITSDMFPEEIIIRFYIKGLDVVKREFEFPGQGDDKSVLAFENVIEGDSVKSSIVYDESGNGSIVLKTLMQYDMASDTRDEVYEFSLSTNGASATDVGFKLDMREDPESSGSIRRKTDISASFKTNDGALGSLQYGLDISSDGTVKRNKNGLPEESEFRIDVVMNSPLLTPQEVKATLGVANETVYGKEVELPGWATGGALDLKTATDEELDSYFEEINKNLSLLIMFLGIS